ncbi:MAG: aminoacyl-histidine dipeptidase [Eubacteriales bacterium]|nr:aminoacyl-histidine dipeptidase [Eubacteriales bacterium]
MAVLSELEPKRVFHYFEEISNIPRGSYHENAISDYLVSFAKERQLEVYQDSLYNVIMFVPASKGYEQEEPVILQGHMDMVCEKTKDASIDMEKEGLTLCVDDQYVFAKDTTLGGDDGIAVAYMLAIAENEEIAHPPLELVITVCEEVGMEGASGIDLSMLKGKRMLNLDSEEEGVFLSSCAGGISLHSKLPVSYEEVSDLCWYTISISGLLGGHSGCEIHKERANANQLLGRLLFEINKNMKVYICAMDGGKKDNAIPLEANVKLGIDPSDYKLLEHTIEQVQQIFKTEYSQSDPGIVITSEECENANAFVLKQRDMEHVIHLLMTLPNGVCGMSMSMPGLVETSLNLGVMKLCDEYLFLQHSIRSSVTSKKYFVANQVECLVRSFGGTVERKGDYPAWEYKEESVVRPRVIALYEKMYGKKPTVEGIHAGLECGLLAGKIADLDCVAMGPDILDIHTTAERLDIASTKRVYEFLLEYLKMKDLN